MDIIWTEEAVYSFEAAHAALEDRFPVAAARFAEKLLAAIDRLSMFPESGKVVPEYENVRLRRCGSVRTA